MSVLVIAEHDNAELKPATLNTVTAAKTLGDVTVLVAGSGCAAVGDAAATVSFGLRRHTMAFTGRDFVMTMGS